MRKKITLSFISFLMVSLAGIAFSSWKLETVQSERITQTVKQDDIIENYSFSPDYNKDTGKNYTFYLFPSTLYLNDYIDYLEENSNLKPEELYGYIEPKFDESGDPVIGENGVMYESIINEKEGDAGYIHSLITQYNDVYLGTNMTAINQIYDSAYASSTDWNQKDYYTTGDISFNKCYIGDPVLDRTEFMSNYNANNGERYMNRNHHRYDRFGYWSTVGYMNGRYLPIKIQVDADFSSELYDLIAMNPYTGMGDSVSWYNYTFPCWSYVEHTENSYVLPSYAENIGGNTSIASSNALAAFNTYDLENYFDLMQNFDRYADSEGIIRLFPTFSNGKNSKLGTAGPAEKGGRDAVRLQADYAMDQNDTVYNDKYMYTFYTTDVCNAYANVNETDTKNIKIAMYSNLNFSNFSSLSLEVAWSFGICSWSGEWDRVYTISEEAIELIQRLFGEGNYNLYLMIGNNVLSRDNSVGTSSLKGMIDSSGYTSYFTSLKGKNLIVLDDIGTSKESDVTYLGTKNPNGYRPLLLCIEKVRSIKILTDIPTVPNESELQNQYVLNKMNFRFLGRDIYENYAGRDKIANMVSQTPLNKSCPYSYILRNVDFTESRSSHFQIRFQKGIDQTIRFSGTTGTTGDDPAPNIDIIYDAELTEDGSGRFSKEQRFVNAFGSGNNGYFETKEISVNSTDDQGNNVSVSEVMFQLKNEEMKGIYDFIIVYRPLAFSSDIDGRGLTFNAGYYVYVYRHTNVFLKVLAQDSVDGHQDGFTDHKSDEWESPNALLFQKEYPIGVHINSEDLTEVDGIQSEEYNWFPQSKTGDSLETCLNLYVDEWIKKNTESFKKEDVILRDHVSGAIVATYNSEGKLICENFRVRKNYVFYVAFR